MEAVRLVAVFLFYTSLMGLLVGLFYKPWIVLWWMDKQNRLMVIKYYGTAVLMTILLKNIAH